MSHNAVPVWPLSHCLLTWLAQILEIIKTFYQTLRTKISVSAVPVGELFCGLVRCSKCCGSFSFSGKLLPQVPHAAQKCRSTSNTLSQHQVTQKQVGNLPTSLERRWSYCFLPGTVSSWRTQSPAKLETCSALIQASKMLSSTAVRTEGNICMRQIYEVCVQYTCRFNINPQNETI